MKTINAVMMLVFGVVILGMEVSAQEVSIPSMIQETQKSVVNIQTDHKYTLRPWQQPDFTQVFSNEYFEKDTWKEKAIEYKSEGSGVFINNSGLILTNSHVIRGAQNIKVFTNDNKEYGATLIGESSQFDLALLQIKADGEVRPIPFGDSKKLAVGQDVFAIGTPFGFKQTVTKGIVSGVDREIKQDNEVIFNRLIQTDTSANPGSSGGPLLTDDGNMVGVIVASLRKGNDINFAIPMDLIEKIIPEMKDNLEEIGWIEQIYNRYGIGLEEIDYDRGDPRLEILTVAVNSQAYKAGIREKDIILRFNKKFPLRNLKAFIDEDNKVKSGDRIYLSVQRNRKMFFTYLEAK